MKTSRRPSDHKLDRALLWARLWLVWWLGRLASLNFKPDFVELERTLRSIVFFRAIKIARIPKRQHCLNCPPPGCRFTAPKRRPVDLALGKSLRRTRHRDIKKRLEALSALTTNIERWIRETAKRLSQGLGHHRLILTRTPEATRFTSAPSAPVAFADSS